MFLLIMANVSEQLRIIYTWTDLCHTSGHTRLVTQNLVTIMNMGNTFLFITKNVSEYLRGIYTRTDLCHTSGYTKHLLHKNFRRNLPIMLMHALYEEFV